MAAGAALNVVLTTTTVIGFGLAIWQALRVEQLNRRERDLDWPRFRGAASDLARAVDRSDFMPDVILALSDRGAIVAHLVARELRTQVPIVTVGYLSTADKTVELPGYVPLRGTKSTVFLPGRLHEQSGWKVLLVDDFVMSGDGLSRAREELITQGFDPGRIRRGAVMATKLALANRKGPDFFAREARDFDFFFPWGRAE
jgi:hypoxanthine phosphoribosyltransferase